ncbi:ATP-binding protein [Psychrosphaera ytuae]|uniref:ATP-binding protein n=1 Tax=Psychrosphaera ytuae TaxID=2820710 RepID=UPI0038CD4151
MLNLISNAIKFTDKGTVTVELAVDQSSGHARITVMDTGIGMSESMCQNLFNRFEQADSSTTRRFGGTGLGMTITRQLVELMKGEITVSSTIGKGTKFVILLPLIETTLDVEEEHHHTESVTPDLTGKHILLAEDNKINQTVFLAMMRPTNATITIAEDGVEAVDAFKNHSPDLIFMDIQMPNMDGIDACKSIRKVNTDIPIIALTANVMDQDVKTYMSSGFDSHLGKPIELNALYREATLYLVSKDQ